MQICEADQPTLDFIFRPPTGLTHNHQSISIIIPIIPVFLSLMCKSEKIFIQKVWYGKGMGHHQQHRWKYCLIRVLTFQSDRPLLLQWTGIPRAIVSSYPRRRHVILTKYIESKTPWSHEEEIFRHQYRSFWHNKISFALLQFRISRIALTLTISTFRIRRVRRQKAFFLEGWGVLVINLEII